MIVSEFPDRIMYESARPVKHPVYRGIGFLETPKLSDVLYTEIIFSPEVDSSVYQNGIYITLHDVPLRWYCQSCIAAGARQDEAFHTCWSKKQDLLDKGSMPSELQARDISEHAKQHSLVWKWARSLK